MAQASERVLAAEERIRQDPNDLEARRALFDATHRIAAHLALRRAEPWLREDAVQQALADWWESVLAWDPASGVPALAFISQRHRWNMHEWIIRQKSVYSFGGGHGTMSNLMRFAAINRELSKKLERPPTDQEMREAGGWRLATVRAYRPPTRRLQVVTTGRLEEDGPERRDEVELVSREPSPLAVAERRDLRRKIARTVPVLRPKHRKVLLRWIAGDNMVTAGREHGWSRERERQVRGVVLRALQLALGAA